jgi:hypothetical protein
MSGPRSIRGHVLDDARRREPRGRAGVARADLNLVGLGIRAERKVVDKIVDGLKFLS